MQILEVSDNLLKSYAQADNYPQNISHPIFYPHALRSYANRLNRAAPELFVRRESDVVVRFRDYDLSCRGKLPSTWHEKLLVQW